MKYSTVGIIVAVLLVVPLATHAVGADHAVISEIKTSGGTGKTTDEFIELYNPTDADVSLAGWKLVKKTAAGSDYGLIDDFGTKTIRAHSYFLVAHPSGYTGSITADAVYSTANSIADNNTILLLNSTSAVVDQVGMGMATVFEGEAAGNPPAGKSIERKAKPDSIVEMMVDGGRDYFAGNGESSGNNKTDFIVREIPEPQNSSSEPEYVTAAAPIVVVPPTNQVPPPTTTPPPSSSTPTTKVVPKNEPPNAEFTVSAPTAKVGVELQFDGADSKDPEGSKLQYRWEFGDGGSATGKTASHPFKHAGQFTVRLTVQDAAGATGTVESTVTVTDYDYSSKVLLNEALPSCDGPDDQCEYVELYNGDSRAVQLEGWTLTDTKTRYRLPAGTAVPAGGYLVLKRTDSKVVLNDTGDTVYLVDPRNTIVSGVTYGAAKTDQSFSRVPSPVGWRWTDRLTPGRANEFPEVEVEQQQQEEAGQPAAANTNTPAIPDAVPVTLALAAVDESRIGQLVTVTADVESVSGRNVYLADAAGGTLRAYVQQVTGIQKVELKPGDSVQITGVVDKTEAGIRLLPRKKEDIIVQQNSNSNAAGVVLGAETSQPAVPTAAAGSSNQNIWYGVGGVVALLAVVAAIVRKVRGSRAEEDTERSSEV
ncbi:MAG: lamin tail domain-containing protein [Patescibacteria group bacterium]